MERFGIKIFKVMKEKIATLLYNLGIRTLWVYRNRLIFYQNGVLVSWNKLENKELDYPYHFDCGHDIYPNKI